MTAQRKSRSGRMETLTAWLRPGWFKALGDPNRLAIVARLACAAKPMTVSEVGGCCGVHISGVSRHLALLRAAGVVAAEKIGREVRYRLNLSDLTGALRGLADAIDACEPSELCNPPREGRKK
ncbi:MAG: metalloregulator ArsR/SmtB family transcription factor [Deltaproteobacteria bacterium]|nr:metalloregulator ArsR/SmtB family transcription factor [Deltaproteobacteria bacterium]